MSAEVDSLPDREPPMFLQRPSSGSSQNVEHILAQTFRDFYTRDYVGQETVRNLNKSRAGDDSYHEKYVEELRKVQAEHERRLAEAAMLSRHIMQARAKALQADERDLEEAAEGCELYHQLGLPPGESNYTSFLDSILLKKHNLIVPEDFSTAERPLARPPRAAKAPHYSLATETSVQHAKIDIPPTDLRSDSSMSTYSVIGPVRSEKEQWKDHMSAEKRELNRKDLAMVYKKSDFLRNPRHRPPSEPAGGKSLIKPNRVVHKLGGAKPKLTVTGKKEPSVVFLAMPSTVVFSDYKVRQVYEMCLDLKNVSAASRQLRVIPPKTEYFSVGLGQFPGDYGIIAPGMSCQYKIRFIPDALIDFDDELQIQTQSSQPLIVKLQGRRKPPQLSLSSVIDCGYCLVGGSHVAQFIVKNTGGSGRFCIMPRDAWPATNLKSLNADRVKLEPFDVQPAMFELPAGYSMLLQVVFTPPSVETFSQNVTMVCDNCHVKHFTLKGEGQSPGVRLVSIKPGGESFPVPGEICDTTAQHQVNFDTLNPMTYTEKKLQVQNTTNVDLPFFWDILKPHLECPDPMMTSSSSDHVISRPQEGGGNFCIAPDQGTLSANSTKDFIVGFSPTTIGSFHNVIHLLLKDIPVTDTTKSTSAKPVHNQENETGIKSTSATSRVPSTKDMVGLEVELKGECEEYHVLVQPYAIIVPGTMLVTTTIRKQFQMVNFSQYPVTFNWSSLSECHIIEVETPQGIIPPGEVADLRLTITGGQPGLIDHTLLCRLEYQEEPLTLRVRAHIKGPEVVIDTPSVDFGLVRYGYEVTEEIVIRNMSQIPAKWSVDESKEFQDEQLQGISEFNFRPSSGVLPALGSTLIKVIFNPTFCRYLSSVFECSIDDGKPCYIGVRADVKKPQACLLSSSLHMPEVYDNVPTQHKVQLLNQTLLPTRFFWGEAQGSQANNCIISFEPKSGVLKPREQLAVDVNFTANMQGKLSDVYIPCIIEGMPTPVCLFLSSSVQGLNISYSIKDSQSLTIENDDLSLDFGEDVEVCTVAKRVVCIKNETAIEAPYHIFVSRFPAGKPPTPPDESKDKTRRRSLLNRTPNIADPMSKSPAKKQADFSKAVLHEGRGLAFVVHPSSGVLGPFAELNVEVSAYSDMWGQYSDDLICKVGALENVVIPMKVSITGCPLNFQMASLKGQIPVVRFGTHIPGVATIKRPLRIINKSPFDVRVDWEIYNLQENDNKLLDMMTSIGEPFPKRDENGLEIIPPAKEDALMVEEKPTEDSKIPQIQTAVQPDNHQVIPESEHPKEVSNTQPQLIRVKLKEHEGNRTEQPFGITCKQMVIPARGNLQITATFSPSMVSLVQAKTVECVGYALGFMSLDEEGVRFMKDIFERLHGYDMTPLRLDLTAFIKPAILTIETSDDDGMLYSTAASHLLVDGRISKEYTKTGLATLTNSTETPLTFQLVVPEPFYLSNIEPAHFEADESFITVIPRHNLQIKVAFRLSSELIQRYLDLLQPDQEIEGVALTKRDQERRFTINKDLQIVYNNSSIQAVPLCATIVIPSLILSNEGLDFGVCLVGQEREKEIVLRNPTSSASFWTAVIDWCSSPDDVVFSLTPSSGMLEAYVTHVSNSKTLLKVHFTPRHNIAYDCIFILSGMLGEDPCYLRVKGEGSYDSRHEALVNI